MTVNMDEEDPLNDMPWDGDLVAERLGLVAHQSLDEGANGIAFLLKDGRVLKLTESETETAIALALATAFRAGQGHRHVPVVEGPYKVVAKGAYRTGSAVWAYVRTGMDDFAPAGRPEEWPVIVERLRDAWQVKSSSGTLGVLIDAERFGQGADLLCLVECLEWLRSAIGVTV
jgi:hypothetical protein